MAAIIRDVTIEQGGVLDETFLLKSNGVPVDLTGYSAVMTVLDNTGAVVHTASSDNGQITINGVAGSVHRKIPANLTLTIPKTAVSYDLALTPPSGAADTWILYRGRCHVLEKGSRGS